MRSEGDIELRIVQTMPERPTLTTQKGQLEKETTAKFAQVLQGYLDEVNKLQIQSEQLDQQLAAGTLENIHDATVAAEKAALAIELTVQIRNKVIEAYQEIMRMPI
ncbi:MAG: flagellar hook-basal body complex protein FliE [Firmicutes bacterium]|nr:flagellar hook-basal body complex protein FliE [Bacillota bacterium]